MKKFLALLLIIAWWPVTALAADYSPGNGYTLIEKPVRTANPDKIEVLEIFWYGCPHCFRLEPLTQSWKKTIASDVDFSFMPAVFGRSWEAHARAYYVSQLLGIENKTHENIFNTIHIDKRRLNTKGSLAKFFSNYGVDEATFNKQYNSFAVNSRLKQADAKIRAYGIQGVPAIIVNGKYLVSASTAGGNQNVYPVVNFLIEKERQAKK
ncbi:thiol:disulfide interchange protein DsbA/DsbL [Marinomonas agarivorans]|nr:thiol:disulfide interchange protein DsbA/DsbL [Marinomonas agarivorans]